MVFPVVVVAVAGVIGRSTFWEKLLTKKSCSIFFGHDSDYLVFVFTAYYLEALKSGSISVELEEILIGLLEYPVNSSF